MAGENNVGNLSYSLELDTSKLIDGQRKVEKSLDEMNGRFRDSAGKLREANGQFVKTGESAASAAKDVSKFGFSLTPIAAGVIAAFATGAVVAFTNKLIEVQREFDKLNSMLQTATGSAEGRDAAFAALQEFAAKTPYDLAQVTKAFTQLVNLGLTPSERALTSYGNTAAAMGKNMGQLVEAVADAVTGEFERLKEFGIKSSAQGDKVVFTFRGMKTEVENSASAIEGYLMALGENQFGGAMALQAATLDGAISNLADSWDSLYRTISSGGVGDAIEDTVRVAISVIDVLIGSLESSQVQLNKTDAAAEEMRRAENIQSWANSSVMALAALADAADVVWQALSVLGRNVAFVFQGVGTEIGGIGAQVAAVMRGDFKQAAEIGDMMKADASKRRSELDKADSATLADRVSWGDKIRAQMGKNSKSVNGVDRLAGFKVGADGGATGGKKGSAKKGKDPAKEAQKEMDAQNKLHLEAIKQMNDQAEQLQASADKVAAEEEKAKQQKIDKAAAVSQQVSESQMSPALLAANEWAEKLAIIEEAQAVDLENQDAYNLAKVNAELEYQDKIKAIRDQQAESELANNAMVLGAASSMFEGMAGLVETYGNKQSDAYKTMFALSKAFSIAQSAMAIQTGVAKALELGFPANVPAMAQVVSAGAGIMSSIKGMNFGGGRQYGGGVSQGTMYRVNETGAPEMFTASNGKQFMMPTSNGNVTPANQVGGGGGGVQIVINNMAGADVTATASPDGQLVEIAVKRAVAEVAGQFRSNSGQVWNAAKNSTNIQGKTA